MSQQRTLDGRRSGSGRRARLLVFLVALAVTLGSCVEWVRGPVPAASSPIGGLVRAG